MAIGGGNVDGQRCAAAVDQEVNLAADLDATCGTLYSRGPTANLFYPRCASVSRTLSLRRAFRSFAQHFARCRSAPVLLSWCQCLSCSSAAPFSMENIYHAMESHR